ncbi:hypothetical protein CORC01_08224 [Colletotrichum orchidophilum]|uniref:Uncharacterized protein n=1 Tax=Colletotrichum orchidophilum TaxID=1209926 RepID=A0A1G4B4X4_9PEZI|nr:uncharacterized protein CORC01_08224 [Colletotrichum orchidophilum]OHE96461.1 hypothetical protein CORC01_08224 [Colletotrichum orchidophilum]
MPAMVGAAGMRFVPFRGVIFSPFLSLSGLGPEMTMVLLHGTTPVSGKMFRGAGGLRGASTPRGCMKADR